MHLQIAPFEGIDDGASARDLGQEPADIVILTAADSEIAALAAVAPTDGLSIALTSVLALAHPMSVDLYVGRTLARARFVVLRLLGGEGYWPYGVESIRRLALGRRIPFASLPGDARWDEAVAARGTLPLEQSHALWRYFADGGPDNNAGALAWIAHALGDGPPPAPPRPVPAAGLWPSRREVDARPRAAILFYRALLQGGMTEPVASLAAALERRGIAAQPIFVTSLKDPVASETLRTAFAEAPPDVVLNATAFAVGVPDGPGGGLLAGSDCPVLQVVFAATGEAEWRASARGLGPRDLAMHVVLPEVDGRLAAGAVAFKERPPGAPPSAPPVLRSVPDRIEAAADLAAAWVRLRRTPAPRRRVGLIVANYPNRDGRLANGVGLDTPESCIALLAAMRQEGYDIGAAPATAAALMELLGAGPTNSLPGRRERSGGERWPLEAYRTAFAALPAGVRQAVESRWGPPERDPHVEDGAVRLALHRFGNVVIGVQPARGYNIDPKATYHAPDLAPPHHYLAFYLWLRLGFRADALVHVGKHGNLEWLPGKATGLSAECFPAAVLGPMPNIYPFIVNDPGEGIQAKRRTSAAIVDHLTPPLARAELHDELAGLERLVDEYALASDLDPRRAAGLEADILASARALRLDDDVALDPSVPKGEMLRRLDAHLCDLKEMQIRDGLHVFGRSPEGEPLHALAVAIARLPRSELRPADASLHRALAADLGLGAFDPLGRELGEPWTGPRPAALAAMSADPWRNSGDTVERLELLAHALVADSGVRDEDLCAKGTPLVMARSVSDEASQGRRVSALGCFAPLAMTGSAGPSEGVHDGDAFPQARPVLDWIGRELMPRLRASGQAEIAGVLTGLAGRFVTPGPSGAPSRGRPDVLPTGRNFYAVDVRAVPTEAAWRTGRAAAERLVERFVQDEGDWPRAIALSCWGTANMRTGGDDVAQALALVGARPTWEPESGRVTGFQVMTPMELRRPRVDVTLRVSGLFRDAFPTQIDLFDSAVRSIAALDEPDDQNPIAAAVRAATLAEAGDPEAASRRAAARVFGSKPGAYGAGLQALVDEGGWADRGDLATAYLAWSGFAYGGGREGEAAGERLRARLAGVDAVVQAQDNREHDILDSDDYYQFIGGLAASVEALTGRAPPIYHLDTSRPEAPLPRTLGEEISRVVRGRAANPKWIAGAMRHGYKGAFEIAATVDYLFGFAASTDAVRPHHFDQLFAAYLENEAVRDFIADANPAALGEIADRFAEAMRRQMWTPRSNRAVEVLAEARELAARVRPRIAEPAVIPGLA